MPGCILFLICISLSQAESNLFAWLEKTFPGHEFKSRMQNLEEIDPMIDTLKDAFFLKETNLQSAPYLDGRILTYREEYRRLEFRFNSLEQMTELIWIDKLGNLSTVQEWPDSIPSFAKQCESGGWKSETFQEANTLILKCSKNQKNYLLDLEIKAEMEKATALNLKITGQRNPRE